MENLRKILEKYHMEKWFQRDNLIVLVLAGILLVVVAWPLEGTDKAKTTDAVEKQGSSSVEGAGTGMVQTTEGQYTSLYEYAAYLEDELEDALMDMSGVGKVKVMITLEAYEEQVVEKDEPFTRNNTTENDGDGGSRTVYQMDSGQETVYEKNGSVETPYVTKTILPKISGILIVAEGAGTGTVSKSISEIAQALFNIEAHKVQVVPMK